MLFHYMGIARNDGCQYYTHARVFGSQLGLGSRSRRDFVICKLEAKRNLAYT